MLILFKVGAQKVSNYMNKISKVIFGGLAAIVLGAIGSGVWEIFVRDLWLFSSAYIVEILFSMSSVYEDSIYREAARGFNDGIAFESYSLVRIVTVLLFLSAFIMVSEHPSVIVFKVYMRYAFATDIAFIMVLATIFAFSATDLVRQVELRKINEIRVCHNRVVTAMSPYVSEDTIKISKSDFVGIENKSDYESLMSSLYSEAEVNHIEIPKCPK